MNVFLSIDMEGVAGVSARRQVQRGNEDYEAARALMAGEANAVVRGAFAAGASGVVIGDSHGDMSNLPPALLDRRAEALIGSPKTPLGMMEGVGPEFDVALFVGYHAGAGVEAGVLAHTYSSAVFYDVRLNGESASEAELNARVAGAHGVPVGLVVGDDKICATVDKRLPGVRTLVVKVGLGNTVTRSLHPDEACARIEAATREVVSGAAGLTPHPEASPYEVEVDLVTVGMAELCALVPGVERVGGRTVRYGSARFLDVFSCLMTWKHLGRSLT